jgi:hypothetical protein
MKLSKTYFLHQIFFISFILPSCSSPFTKTETISDNFFSGTVTIEKNKKLQRYSLSIYNEKTGGIDRIFTPYEVFTMHTGDVNGDGRTDICLGIIKPTPFDSVLKKRLFIFKIDKDYIRPLWLSSRLVRPLENFKVISRGTVKNILAIERENGTKFGVSEYSWSSFGMQIVEKHGSSLSLTEAQNILSRY